VLETEKFKQAVDSATDGILIVNTDGRIVYLNNTWVEITGYNRSDLIGQNIHLLQQHKSSEKIYAKIWQALTSKKQLLVEDILSARKNGEYYQAQLALYPIKEDGEIKYFVCMQQDITKRKEVERAKTEFVSLASHQLRTPLSTISWYSEMLMNGDAGELTEEQKKLLAEVVDSNKRMVNLVNALLNVSRIELGTFSVETKWTNIVNISDSVIKELSRRIEQKKHKLTTDYSKTITDIKTDPNLMRVLFQNLISNAIKYTPDGGEILVSIKDNPLANSIKISIADNGVGIPGRQQDQIFNKLFRADNVKQTDTEGTGLGLYLVKAIVDYAKGQISFRSKENEGTTFEITLPMTGMDDNSGKKEIIPEIPRISSSALKPL
jgi:PAS domain S-box-containing protein